ncbi:MAG: hypothetical protein ACKODH_06955 [Limisphaerales bacterium]
MRRRPLDLPRWRLRLRNRKQKRLVRAFIILLFVSLVVWVVYENLPEPARPPTNTAEPG